MAPFQRFPRFLLLLRRVPDTCCQAAALIMALIFSPAGLAATPDSVLPASVATALRESGIQAQQIAILVQGVEQDKPLLAYNTRRAMNPASTMKLLTTYAALELLGPAYTWSTDALLDQAPGDKPPDGALYLRGSGDPKLMQEHLWLLLRQLRARGMTEIGGDVVLDRSAFALPAHDPAAFDNEPLRPYNAGPDALLINLKSIRLTLAADPAGKTVRVVFDTPGEQVRIINRLALVAETCGDWREKLKVGVNGATDSGSNAGSIELSGKFPDSCGEKALHLSPWPADVQVGQLFRALWHELGGTLSGKVREGKTPPTAQSIVVQESPPLGEIVRDINKYSNNVMARQLFLTLAAERPATPEGARRRVSAWLEDKGLRLPGLVLDNGSGLSRLERISAEGMARLLLAAWKSPVMPELMASLPLAGVDGTLKKRLGDHPASGRAHLKTGYLEGVRAIAGYVLDRSGQRWVVVCLINDPQAKAGKPVMDTLLRWVAEH